MRMLRFIFWDVTCSDQCSDTDHDRKHRIVWDIREYPDNRNKDGSFPMPVRKCFEEMIDIRMDPSKDCTLQVYMFETEES